MPIFLTGEELERYEQIRNSKVANEKPDKKIVRQPIAHRVISTDLLEDVERISDCEPRPHPYSG